MKSFEVKEDKMQSGRWKKRLELTVGGLIRAWTLWTYAVTVSTGSMNCRSSPASYYSVFEKIVSAETEK